MAAASLVTLASSTGSAATVITLTESGNESGTQTLYLDTNRLRITARHGGIIYRGDQGKVFELDDQTHTYREMSPDSTKVLKQMGAMMTPSCDKSAEGDQALTAPQEQFSDRKARGLKKIGRWYCMPTRTFVNENLEIETCDAKLSDLGLTFDDLKPLIDFSTFIGIQMSPKAIQTSPNGSKGSPRQSARCDGFFVQSIVRSPVKHVEFRFTVQSIEHRKLSESTFDIPVR